MKTAIIGVCLFVCSVCAESSPQCTLDESDFSARQLPKLTSWRSLYKSFQANVPQCDDGFFGEGYSDVVVALLVRHWSTLPQLATLSRQSPSFEAFVLRHIDATTEGVDLKALKANASARCPSSSAPLCNRIISAATMALSQLGDEAEK
jgi:hypothetical protein